MGARGVAALLGSLFVLAQEIPGLDTFAIVVISDLGQLLAVSATAVLCWLASPDLGSHTRAWRALAVVGAWVAGQTDWTYYEVVAGTEVPFPSPADLGFLTFPIVAGFGLLTWLGTQGHARIAARGRDVRDVLDGAVIALSLLVLSWVTSLGRRSLQQHWRMARDRPRARVPHRRHPGHVGAARRGPRLGLRLPLRRRLSTAGAHPVTGNTSGRVCRRTDGRPR